MLFIAAIRGEWVEGKMVMRWDIGYAMACHAFSALLHDLPDVCFTDLAGQPNGIPPWKSKTMDLMVEPSCFCGV